jgi:7,8-dihydroneopterin aldolase/epimerase/oxygenase
MIDYNIIRIKNAVFYAYHGAMEDEQNLGGKFECDADLYCDFAAAAESDSLRKTVDYEKVYVFMKEAMLHEKYHLLEALASSLARGILREFSSVEKVIIRIRKPHPPVKGVVDHIEVEVTEHR